MVPTGCEISKAEGKETSSSPSSTIPAWRAKVSRGHEHRDALVRYITETFSVEGNLPTLAIRFDVETLDHVLYVKRIPDLSEFYSRVGLIFGDCVNNFRNALDYLVYEMGVRYTGQLKHPERIKFPIFSKIEGWVGVERNQLAEVSEKQRRVIERFQPYHGRNLVNDIPQGQDSYHPLNMLRELTDFDKHRLLTPIVVPHGNTILMGPLARMMMSSGKLLSSYARRL